MTARIGSLCSGYDGLATGIMSAIGGELAFVADNDPGAAMILAHRFPGVPNLGDIAAVDWATVEPVDVLCAGFPCQDVSCAGARQGLREGNRSGVWAHVARAIEALRPPMVVIENVGGLLSADADSHVERCPWCMGTPDGERPLRALGAVLGDLAGLGFDADWIRVSAADAGSCHLRERVFIHAWPATEDPDCATGGKRRLAAPGQAPRGGARADAGRPGGAGVAAADAGRTGGATGAAGQADVRGEGPRAEVAGRPPDTDGGGLAADSRGPGLPLGKVEHHGPQFPAAQRGNRDGTAGIDWRQYEPAIRRWESVFRGPVPRPVEPGRTGERLSPAFVEWMMGLPAGWVTAVPGLTRRDQLKALGNGCVPQQVALAVCLLLGGVPRREIAVMAEAGAA